MAAVAVIGGGPAGLMAAEVLLHGGAHVDLYDSMPSVGRKFLIAGKGGLNLTHSEPFDKFITRYGARRDKIEPMLRRFGPDDVRAWAWLLGAHAGGGALPRFIALSAPPRVLGGCPLPRAGMS